MVVDIRNMGIILAFTLNPNIKNREELVSGVFEPFSMAQNE